MHRTQITNVDSECRLWMKIPNADSSEEKRSGYYRFEYVRSRHPTSRNWRRNLFLKNRFRHPSVSELGDKSLAEAVLPLGTAVSQNLGLLGSIHLQKARKSKNPKIQEKKIQKITAKQLASEKGRDKSTQLVNITYPRVKKRHANVGHSRAKTCRYWMIRQMWLARSKLTKSRYLSPLGKWALQKYFRKNKN